MPLTRTLGYYRLEALESPATAVLNQDKNFQGDIPSLLIDVKNRSAGWVGKESYNVQIPSP
jgi:hypothetical protein